MTGKEILEEGFEKAGMRGYKADQVDEFLQKIAAFVDEQEAEKNDLIYKIKILAEKIEEYKGDEENIRDALLGAQKLGTSILNEAKSKAESLTREARMNHDELMSQAKAKVELLTKESIQKVNADLNEIKRETEKERIAFEKMKKEVSNFKASILKQYKTHLDLLSNLPSVADEPKSNMVFREEVRDEIKPIFFDQDAIENEFKAAQAESAAAFAQPQTITSNFLTNEKELAEEEFEQTKEFAKEQSDEEELPEEGKQEEFKINFGAPAHQRPNYMEKFGELKFGGFSQSDK